MVANLHIFFRIWDHLIDISKTSGTTIIITTHYIEEARKADYVGLIRYGRILAEQPPENLMRIHNEAVSSRFDFKLFSRTKVNVLWIFQELGSSLLETVLSGPRSHNFDRKNIGNFGEKPRLRIERRTWPHILSFLADILGLPIILARCRKALLPLRRLSICRSSLSVSLSPSFRKWLPREKITLPSRSGCPSSTTSLACFTKTPSWLEEISGTNQRISESCAQHQLIVTPFRLDFYSSNFWYLSSKWVCFAFALAVSPTIWSLE